MKGMFRQPEIKGPNLKRFKCALFLPDHCVYLCYVYVVQWMSQFGAYTVKHCVMTTVKHSA